MEPNPQVEGNSTTPQSLAKSPNNQSTVIWDIEYIFTIISMFILATAIGQSLHYFVDKFYPPVIIGEGSYSIFGWIFELAYYYGEGGALPMYISTMIVAYPIFAFLFIHTKKREKQNPELQDQKLRKGLIYIVLVVTFLLMLYKMISLVYGSLTGNFSINFLLHFLITVVISGVIFAYFFYVLKSEKHV